MVVQSISMLPLVKDKVTKCILLNTISNIRSSSTLPTFTTLSILQAFIFMHVLFKILGAKAFQKMSLLDNMASVARKAIYHHFEQITKVILMIGDHYDNDDA